MKITLGRKQSFWRPVNPKNDKDLSVYLCPIQPFINLDWDKLPEWVKLKIKSSHKLGLIVAEGIPAEAAPKKIEVAIVKEVEPEIVEEVAFTEVVALVEEVKEEVKEEPKKAPKAKKTTKAKKKTK